MILNDTRSAVGRRPVAMIIIGIVVESVVVAFALSNRSPLRR